jgi:hypothetical protein
MSATMMSPKMATTPFSEAASLQYYTKKSSPALTCLAKLRSLSHAGSQQEIVARLMAQDKETDTWPGMYEVPNKTAAKKIVVGEKKDGEDTAIAPIKQVSAKAETPSKTKVTAEVKPKTAVSAIVSRNATMTTSIAGATSRGSSENGPAIPMSQLADEWDQQWGAPYAFPRRATIVTKSQGTSRAPRESVSSRSKSPVTPASPASPFSPVSSASPATPVSPTPTVVPTPSKSNRYDLLFSEEEEDDEPEEKEEEQVVLLVKKDTKKAPRVHQKADKTPSVREEKKEELSAVSSDGLDSGEKTKKKKRSKKGGKKANKNKAIGETTETETTDAAGSDDDDDGAALQQSKTIPTLESPAQSTTMEASKAMREAEVDTPVESPVIVKDYGAIGQTSSPTTPKRIPAFAGMSAPEQVDRQGISHLARSPVQAAESTKKSLIEIFVTPPPSSPPAAAQPASSPTQQPASAPTTTKNQRRNEKRKQDKAVAPSNIYDALVFEESENLPAQTHDYEASDSDSASIVRAKKSKKRGKKGGKKVQAQKQKEHQVVASTLVQHVVAVPTSMAAPAAMGTVVLVAVVAAVLCAWVVV